MDVTAYQVGQALQDQSAKEEEEQIGLNCDHLKRLRSRLCQQKLRMDIASRDHYE